MYILSVGHLNSCILKFLISIKTIYNWFKFFNIDQLFSLLPLWLLGPGGFVNPLNIHLFKLPFKAIRFGSRLEQHLCYRKYVILGINSNDIIPVISIVCVFYLKGVIQNSSSQQGSFVLFGHPSSHKHIPNISLEMF